MTEIEVDINAEIEAEDLFEGRIIADNFHFENEVLFSNDTGMLGKRNSEFSQQESNLRPSDY